jgi:hypothetical protein
MANIYKYRFFSGPTQTVIALDNLIEIDNLQDLQLELEDLKRSTFSYIEIHCRLLAIVTAIENQIKDLTAEQQTLLERTELSPRQGMRLALVTSAIDKQAENITRIYLQIAKSRAAELIAQRLSAIDDLEQRIESKLTTHASEMKFTRKCL